MADLKSMPSLRPVQVDLAGGSGMAVMADMAARWVPAEQWTYAFLAVVIPIVVVPWGYVRSLRTAPQVDARLARPIPSVPAVVVVNVSLEGDHMRLRLLFAAFVTLCICASHSITHAQSGRRADREGRVTTEFLPALISPTGVSPTDINNRGDVVGSLGASNEIVPFLWTRRDGLIMITEAGYGQATGINSAGTVVGWSWPDQQGWMWSPRDGLTWLGAFVPSAINNSRQIAGNCTDTDELWACIWERGVLTRIARGIAVGIAQNGVVTGSKYDGPLDGLTTSPFRWSYAKGIELLPIPSGLPTDGFFPPGGTGFGINAAGRVVGFVADSLDNLYPAEWTRSGVSFLPYYGLAVDVNARGQSVGFWESEAGNVAYTKTAKEQVITLAVGARAAAINDAGDIVGVIQTEGGEQVVVWRLK